MDIVHTYSVITEACVECKQVPVRSLIAVDAQGQVYKLQILALPPLLLDMSESSSSNCNLHLDTSLDVDNDLLNNLRRRIEARLHIKG